MTTGNTFGPLSVREEENDSEPRSDDGKEEGELPEKYFDSTPTEIGSHASMAQELIKDLAEAGGKAPLKYVHRVSISW